MPMPWKYQQYLLSMQVALAMTTLGAIAIYANGVIRSEKFNWVVLMLQVIVSIFSGALLECIPQTAWSERFFSCQSGCSGSAAD